MKILLISGSPRKGNSEFILRKIYDSIKKDKKLVLLKNKKIGHCVGCLSCIDTNKCIFRDDMDQIFKDLMDYDVFVICSPNYFDNVTGLLKDFIDRTNPFYKTDLLKGKKIINIVVGARKEEFSKRITDQALTYFARAHKLEILGNYCFRGNEIDDIRKDPDSIKLINEIIYKISDIKL